MDIKTVLVTFMMFSALASDDLEKSQKKALEAQVKVMTAEARNLQKSGQLARARTKYAESQALVETKDVTEAIKHLDEEIHKQVKGSLNEARKLYELHKYKEASIALEHSMELEAYQSVLTYDLALCYYQLGERDKALEFMSKAKTATIEPKQRQKLMQLLTYFSTGENGNSVKDTDKDRIGRVNHLADSIGLEASLGDAGGAEELAIENSTESAAAPPEGKATPVALQTAHPAPVHGGASTGHRSSLCDALTEIKGALATSPSATFNLANCAETNARTAEAVRLLEKYLELAPGALDAEESHTRIAELKALLTLPGQNGLEVRRLYASAYGALAEHKYDVALAAFKKAETLAPEFALTKWKLGLFYEALGNVDEARANLIRYQELAPAAAAKDKAALHLSTLAAKRTKYDEEIDQAGDLLADLFNRSMNLTFNGSENRSAMRAKRARVKKNEQNKAKNKVGGFAIPFAYAQQQLGRASEHLQIALALFPLGAEAHQLLGLVFLQANDGHSATRSFDVVASQSLPVAFYAEMRGRKQDQAVKCELTHDRVRLIYLSSYDKKGNPVAPGKPAGQDGLGDLVIDPSATRPQEFESLELPLSEIKKVETDKGLLKIKLSQQEITLAPIYLPSFTPVEGPPARRFANNYTRLFVRYPGLEDSKLGAEGMNGGEKFMMGYKIANASIDIAMSGFTPISAISSVQDAMTIARTIQAAKVSLTVSFATWEKSVDDQQQLLAGKAFKTIPVQPMTLAFVQELK
ncbi:MAG TPA: tetratricopeptide repeat protein [Candidatus Saccharimonadales bacterium]|nr:tetratricopeptide repeat protein [Candidatus Saccharimonadales bacterium]